MIYNHYIMLLVDQLDNVADAVQYEAVETSTKVVCACHTKLITLIGPQVVQRFQVKKTRTHDGP